MLFRSWKDAELPCAKAVGQVELLKANHHGVTNTCLLYTSFDPHDPFANRDPRCLETFAAPGSRIYGIEWNPAPVSYSHLR